MAGGLRAPHIAAAQTLIGCVQVDLLGTASAVRTAFDTALMPRNQGQQTSRDIKT